MADKTEHPYANVLRWIAAGERVEWLNPDGYWREQNAKQNLNEVVNAYFAPSTYRIKPQTITIGKYEVAEPMKVAPAEGTQYWGIQPGNEGGLYQDHWADCSFEHLRIKAGMCWLKREDAELAAKAITELLTGKAT